VRAPALYLISFACALASASCGKNSEGPSFWSEPNVSASGEEQSAKGAAADRPTPAQGPAGAAGSSEDVPGYVAQDGKPTEPPAPPPEPSPMQVPTKRPMADRAAARPVTIAPGPDDDVGTLGRKKTAFGVGIATQDGADSGAFASNNRPTTPAAVPSPDALSAAIGGGWRGDTGKVDMDDEAPAIEEAAKAMAGPSNDKKVGRAERYVVDPNEAEPDPVLLEELEKKKEETAKDARLQDGEGHGEARQPRGAQAVVFTGEDPDVFVPPATTLPRMFYFENTYLGGSAAYAERLRRLDQALQGQSRPYEIVQAEVQPFDAPRTEGLGVTASIDATHFEKARRVFLQVGLRGSSRYGWRRPPLDIVLVVDQPAFARGADFVTGFVVDLLRRLGPADRLGIVLAGIGAPTFLDLSRLNTAQQHLANRIDQLAAPSAQSPSDLANAMQKAGVILDAASDDEATVPGTKTLLVLSGEHDQDRIVLAAQAAHVLTVQGCVTSVFALDAEQSEWWQVANAGFGNLHRITESQFAPAVEEEMQSLARVVARLVRVNVRLGKEATAIRVLGTRVLEQREVEEVKARELATDINLSKSLGITSDRGEDDDGIQTVIPYFYGDDSHVILIELWVEGPGTVADVTVRYKDMVNLDNATARTSVLLGARPQPPTREQILIARNVRGFQLAESLQKASDAVWRNDFGSALEHLGAAKGRASDTNAMDVRAIDSLRAMVEQGDWQNDTNRRATLQETLLISGQRRVGDTNQQAPTKK